MTAFSRRSNSDGERERHQNDRVLLAGGGVQAVPDGGPPVRRADPRGAQGCKGRPRLPGLSSRRPRSDAFVTPSVVTASPSHSAAFS